MGACGCSCMAHVYGNPCIGCFNLLATAWLCAYCCGPVIAPVAVVTPGPTVVSEAPVVAGSAGLPLLAVSSSPARMER